MTKQLVIAMSLGSILASPAMAHADNDGEAELAYTGLAYVGATLTTVAFGVADVAARPDSTAYGVTEIAVAAPLAALDAYIAIREQTAYDSDNSAPMFAALAVLETAVAVHGVYILKHRGERAPTRVVTPVPVSDGRTVGAGFGLSGSF